MDTNSPVFGGARGRRSRIVLAWTAAALALICDAGCGRSGGAVIGEQPVKQVISVENDVDALRAWSAKGAKASVLIRIDPSDGMTVFPANLMDDMNAAAGYLRRRNTDVLQKIAPLIEHGGTVSLGYMAGMYKRVVWVTPSVRSVGETPVEVLKNFLVTRRGYPAAALADFKVDGKWISGSITGVPVTITSLADLSLREGENAVVDINLSYFTAMKLADPSYRMGTKSLLGFLRELGAKNVRADLVTVNLSTQDNLVPMDLRYYGAVVRDALEKPGFLTGAMPAKWRSMIQADDSLGAKRYESAAAIYRDLTGTVKDDPGLYFSLAIAEGFSNKGAECRAALLEAYRLDPEYLKGFFQLARVLADAGKIDAGLEILDTPDLSKIIAEQDMEYQRGVFFYTAHRPIEAATLLGNVAQSRPKDFGLFTILYRAQRDCKNERGQAFALQRLVDIDDARVRREMPWVYADLGDLYARTRRYGDARNTYEKYLAVHPGDSVARALRNRIDTWKAKGLVSE